MIQQEANLFDKGLSLDTSPIATDNHMLTGALNATMITMNGNELVLQNDMGNAKVESAHLPSGYVPVGMKEFGGIVYVASYNPIEEKSLIGCFPSPERNKSSEDEGKNSIKIKGLDDFIDENNNISEISKKFLLIDDIIRPGDKFIITGDSSDLKKQIDAGIINVKILIEGSDGTSIDITNDMVPVYNDEETTRDSDGNEVYSKYYYINYIYDSQSNETPDDDKFTINKSKVSGKIFIQISLNIPAYISTTVSANINSDDKVDLTFNTSAYDVNNEKINYSYIDYEILSSAGEEIQSVELSDVITYTVTPKLTYNNNSYNLNMLSKTNIIDISKLGTGKVDFGLFRYYNQSDEIELEYDLNVYIDNSNHVLNSVTLQLTDIQNNPDETTNFTEIELPTSNYFGNYIERISFDNNLDKNKLYFARIKTVVKTVVDAVVDAKESYTPWYCLYTSTLANLIYMKDANKSMIDLSESETIEVDYIANWTNKEISDNFQYIEDDNNVSPISKIKSGDKITYGINKTGQLSLLTKVEYILPELPFEYTINSNLSVTNSTDYENLHISQLGNLKDDLNINIEEESIIYQNNELRDLKIKSELSECTISIPYILPSHFKANYAISDNSQTDDEKYLFHKSFDNVSAYVPYVSLYDSPDNQRIIEKILGTSIYCDVDSSNNEYTYIQPKQFFTYERTYNQRGGIDASLNWIAKDEVINYAGVIEAGEHYYTTIDMAGLPTGDNSETNYGNHHQKRWIGKSNKNDNLDKIEWDSLKNYFNNSFSNDSSCYFWIGRTSNFSSKLFKDTINNIYYHFSALLFKGDEGNIYLLNKIFNVNSSDNTNLDINNQLFNMIKHLNNIYVYRDGQKFNLDYYKASDDIGNYVYNLEYNLNLNIDFKIKPELKYNYSSEEENDSSSEKYKLPQFQLKESNLTINRISKSIESYDISDIVNNQYLNISDESLSADMCLIETDESGTHLITNAVNINGLPEKISENPQSVYYKLDPGKFINCKQYDVLFYHKLITPEEITSGGTASGGITPTENRNKLGFNFARAIYNNKIIYKQDNESTSGYSFKIHESVINNNKTTTNTYVGSLNGTWSESGKYMLKVHEILGRNRVLNLDLFPKDSNLNNVDEITL